MIKRNYKGNITKLKLSQAYGFQRDITIVNRIVDRLQRLVLDPEKKETLKGWDTHKTLLPGQVKIIVEDILGLPEDPDQLYTEKNV